MGTIYTRPPERSTMSNPIMRLPFTDITGPVGFHDGDDHCFPFQLRFIDCCEAYGREMAKEKCKFLYQDFIECSRGWKQTARCADMLDRHYYLWFQGLTGKGEKRPLFNETPRYDGYVPTFLYDDVHFR